MKIRQGDLIFSKVEEKTTGKEYKELTISEGEFTGHHHVLVAEAGSRIVGNKTRFTLTGKAKLTHPEHDSITFPKGNYIVSVEREFDYVEEQMKAVRD